MGKNVEEIMPHKIRLNMKHIQNLGEKEYFRIKSKKNNEYRTGNIE